MTQPSFWDVSDYDAKLSPVRDTIVAKATPFDVADFCKTYHYTHSPGSALWNYGLWDGPMLLGTVAYNIPVQDACDAVFGKEHRERVLHMGRLAMADKAQRNSESRLIAGSLKLLAVEQPNCWAVVTYADANVGHIGYVYQATNALYTGTGGSGHFYRDLKGIKRPTNANPNGGYLKISDAEAMGWTVHRSPLPKYRYVYILGNRTQRKERRALLKYSVLPYPKVQAVEEEAS